MTFFHSRRVLWSSQWFQQVPFVSMHFPQLKTNKIDSNEESNSIRWEQSRSATKSNWIGMYKIKVREWWVSQFNITLKLLSATRKRNNRFYFMHRSSKPFLSLVHRIHNDTIEREIFVKSTNKMLIYFAAVDLIAIACVCGCSSEVEIKDQLKRKRIHEMHSYTRNRFSDAISNVMFFWTKPTIDFSLVRHAQMSTSSP